MQCARWFILKDWEVKFSTYLKEDLVKQLGSQGIFFLNVHIYVCFINICAAERYKHTDIKTKNNEFQYDIIIII